MFRQNKTLKLYFPHANIKCIFGTFGLGKNVFLVKLIYFISFIVEYT